MAGKKTKDFSAANMAPVYNGIAEAIDEPEAAEMSSKSAASEPQGVADMPEVDQVQDEQAKPSDTRRTRGPRKTYTQEEALEYAALAATRGRKGVKMPRINMAYRPDVYDYILTMARVRGQSLAQFVDATIRKDMETNMDIYKEAKRFIERMGG